MSVTSDNLPFVSVIVPLYNDEFRISDCIGSIVDQSYPSDFYEIIIVDNGSTDDSIAVVAQFPVKLLHENDIQSSYAARNRGVNEARGDILAFTDSDCTPVNDWIAQGINALQSNSADLVSGNVRFMFSPQKTGAEAYDSLTNMQIKKNISEQQVSKTANLFVRKEVFAAIGQFPTVQSGGDVLWTGKATGQGFKLIYHSPAEVAHPTRKLREMAKKQYRVGKGQARIRAEKGGSIFTYLLMLLIKKILPSQVFTTFFAARKRADAPIALAFRAGSAAYICGLANFAGNLIATLSSWQKDY